MEDRKRTDRRPSIYDEDELQGCDFEFDCPKDWKKLKRTFDSKVRFCDSCQKNVHLCLTREDLERFSGERICVSVILKHSRPKMGLMLEPPK